MRTLERNNQKMFYSIRNAQTPVYERNDDGNIVMVDLDDGTQVPSETGEYELSYELPIEFKACIGSKLHEALVRAFGTDDSSNYAQIVCNKHQFDFNVGTRIWRESEVKYKDSSHTEVDASSADYEVRGVLTESLNEDMYYLKVLNHEETV